MKPHRLTFALFVVVLTLVIAFSLLTQTSTSANMTSAEPPSPESIKATIVTTATGIYGQVTFQGTPIESISVGLQRCGNLGPRWSCPSQPISTALTQPDGSYLFSNPPSLGVNQAYRTSYSGTGAPYLDTWYSGRIYSYTQGTSVHGGDFDIADLALISPTDNTTITLPYIFEWTPRPATPSDIYQFELYRLDNESEFVVAVGYTGSYTLNMLPFGFPAPANYIWRVRVLGPNGGQGYDYFEHTITILGPVQQLPYAVYLPLITKPAPNVGIYGRVTFQGNPVGGVILALQRKSGTSYSTVITTTTKADGSYLFTDVYNLVGDQQYRVQYGNHTDGNPDNPNYLYYCGGPRLYSYTYETNAHGGDLDIANIPLVAPTDGATIALPYTFRWTPRTATPSDSYGLEMYASDGTGEYLDTGPLGYIGSYTMSSLPTGFVTNKAYEWNIYVEGTGTGCAVGYSYQYPRVMFSSLDN